MNTMNTILKRHQGNIIHYHVLLEEVSIKKKGGGEQTNKQKHMRGHSHSNDHPGSHCLTLASLELTMQPELTFTFSCPPAQPPENYYYRYEPPCSLFLGLGTFLKGECL